MTVQDHFRESFNFFKQRSSHNSSRVIDADRTPLNENLTLHSVPNTFSERSSECALCNELGIVSHENWIIYSLKDFDGVFLLRNPFTAAGQVQWIRRCLEQYTMHHCLTNLYPQNPDLSPSLDKLRWATLGYHYDWDTKEYHTSKYSPFPPCLSSLSRHLALRLKFNDFMPDAAIMNYYPRKATLGIHNDHSEEAIDQPLVSMSFGLSAIFLVGTSNRTEPPVSLLLRSGDVIFLSGKSRLAYHAVPAVIMEPHSQLNGAEELGEMLNSYIQNHRINISVRQVYKLDPKKEPLKNER